MPLSIATICRRLHKEYGPVELGEPLPPRVVWKAPVVTGKSLDCVKPVM